MGNEQKKWDQGEIGAAMFAGGFVVLILSALLTGSLGIVSLILMIISLFSIIIGMIMVLLDRSNANAAHRTNMKEFQIEYDNYVEKLGIVKSDTQVTMIEVSEYSFTRKISHYLWIANDCMELFPMAQYYI